MTANGVSDQATYNIWGDQQRQALTVSSFYGPGSWAAWCIVLLTSWIPIIQNDYTHNLHFISYALYTNWAAVDALRHLSPYWQVLSIVEREFFRIDAAHQSSRIGGSRDVVSTSLLSKLSTEELAAYLIVSRESYSKRLEFEALVSDQIPADLEAVMAISTATRAVLNIGIVHVLMQLLVCSWRAAKVTGTESEIANRRRRLIMILGLLVPSFVNVSEIISDFYYDLVLVPETVSEMEFPMFRAVLTVHTSYIVAGVCLITVLDTLRTRMRFPSRFSFRKLQEPVYWLSFVGVTQYLGSSLGMMWYTSTTEKRCFLIPCTSVQIGEMDQAFALSVALLIFVWEYGAGLLISVAKFFGWASGRRSTSQTWFGARVE